MNVCPASGLLRQDGEHKPLRIPSFRDRGGEAIQLTAETNVGGPKDAPIVVVLHVCRKCGATYIPKEARNRLCEQVAGKTTDSAG